MDRIAGLTALGLTLALGAGCGGGGDSGGVSDFVGAGDGASCLVPESQLVSGGPGHDGIPALSNPVFVTASDGDTFLAPGALVLGVVEGGEARAYPHNVLWWHEIINDELGGAPITVSYCPLTGSGMVYEPRIGGQTLNFGVSGLLFDNNLVLFDRSTDSLCGDEDEPCLEPGLYLKRTIPSAGLSVLPQSGHTINLEEPDVFNHLVLEFLATVESGRWGERDPRSLGSTMLGATTS